jgi:hypothetical protein
MSEVRPFESANSGVYRAPDEAAIRQCAEGVVIELVHIDLARATDKAAVLEVFARELGFPKWFGGNWDALEDCLTDLSWRRSNGWALVIAGAQHVPADDLGVLRDILSTAAEYWSERGKAFFALFSGPQAASLPEFPPRSR